MRQLISVLGLSVLLVACGQGQQAENPPPVAEQRPFTLSAHGDDRSDPYYWMRDREDPAVIEYLEAENAYAETFFGPLAEAREAVFQELVGYQSETRESVPYAWNGYVYETRFDEGAEYAVISRTSRSGGDAQVLVDGPALAEPHEYFALGDWDVALSNNRVAYSIDTTGRELYDITSVDLETGEVLDTIAETDGTIIWMNDGSGFYYVRNEEETLRPYQVWRHLIGAPEADDVLIFQEDDSEFFMYIERTTSSRYMLIYSYLRNSTEVQLVNLNDPAATAVMFEPRRTPHQYFVDHVGDTFVIRSDEDAYNFQVFAAGDLGGRPGDWQISVPHRTDTLIEGMALFANFMVLEERTGGTVQMHVYDRRSGQDYLIDVGEEVGMATFTGGPSDVVNPDPATNLFRFSYSSHRTPTTVYGYDMAARELSTLRQDDVQGGFSSDNYEQARVWATADDGTLVPISLAWRTDAGPADGPRPLMLRGYGAYGSSYDPTFTYAWLPLMDHGYVLATAHIRGGTEMGRQWYFDGSLLNKINTFTDYIAAAEYLVAEGWTTNDQMFARGGSAGGLLLGAVVNMEPDLFVGILNHVPFVDVVTTMSDATIPLTTYEWVEWGNPIESEESYNYMLSYSPYDNLSAQDYPHMFITAGLNDPRVQYWEPAKYVARLRTLDTGDNQTVFRVNMGSGHFGTTGRFAQYRDIADEIVYMDEILRRVGGDE